MTAGAMILGDRRVWTAGLGLLVAAGLCATTGAAQGLTSARGLGPLLPAGTAVSTAARDNGDAAVVAPPGTVVSSPIDATAAADATGLHLDGTGDDGGVQIGITGLAAPPPAGRMGRGDRIGTAGTTALIVTVSVDGHRVDAAPLVEVAQSGDAGSPVRPVLGAVVTQGFGCTAYVREPVDARCPGGHVHSGIDLAAPLGTPVQAMLGGAVTVVHSETGYGLHVLIDHGGGLVSLYGHLDSVSVATGDVIATGGVLGRVGSTGNSSGPHLHFEVRRDGAAIDPSLEVALP